MSGVNNVALWTGIQASPYVPFINIAPIVGGTNGISPIFLTTVGVTGGIGLDLKNWVKKLDANGEPILDDDGEPGARAGVLGRHGHCAHHQHQDEEALRRDGHEGAARHLLGLTPQKLRVHPRQGSYAVVFGKKLQTTAAGILGIDVPPVYAKSKEISHEGQGLTAVEKISTTTPWARRPARCCTPAPTCA